MVSGHRPAPQGHFVASLGRAGVTTKIVENRKLVLFSQLEFEKIPVQALPVLTEYTHCNRFRATAGRVAVQVMLNAVVSHVLQHKGGAILKDFDDRTGKAPIIYRNADHLA
jgi:hypothetical protein